MCLPCNIIFYTILFAMQHSVSSNSPFLFVSLLVIFPLLTKREESDGKGRNRSFPSHFQRISCFAEVVVCFLVLFFFYLVIRKMGFEIKFCPKSLPALTGFNWKVSVIAQCYFFSNITLLLSKTCLLSFPLHWWLIYSRNCLSPFCLHLLFNLFWPNKMKT